MEENQRAISRSLEIVKSRGHSYQMGRHTFRIIDGHGLQVYHRVQAPRPSSRDRAAAYDPTTRISTGIPGLNERTNGGYFVGSTTVVAGISGVGKSVMACQYIAVGARRGERSLMLSLDEQVEQILRNAATIGIDLRAEIDRDLVRLEYELPQRGCGELSARRVSPPFGESASSFGISVPSAVSHWKAPDRHWTSACAF
jgi:circadian clock protein KaiC